MLISFKKNVYNILFLCAKWNLLTFTKLIIWEGVILFLSSVIYLRVWFLKRNITDEFSNWFSDESLFAFKLIQWRVIICFQIDSVTSHYLLSNWFSDEWLFGFKLIQWWVIICFQIDSVMSHYLLSIWIRCCGFQADVERWTVRIYKFWDDFCKLCAS